MSVLAWGAMAAMALPPDRQTGAVDVGASDVERFAVTSDGRWVAGRSKGDKSLWLIDVEDWSSRISAVCDVTGVSPWVQGDDLDLWVSCEDGTLRLFHPTDTGFVAATTDDGAEVSVQISDSALHGVWGWEDTNGILSLLVVSWSGVSADPAYVHALAADDWENATYRVGNQLLDADFKEGAVTGSYLIVSHGPSITPVFLTSGTPGLFTPAPGITALDIVPSSLNEVALVDEDGVLATYSGIISQFTIRKTGLPAPKAVAWSSDPDDDWIVIYGDEVQVYDIVNGVIEADPVTVVVPESGESAVQDAVVSDGYVFGGGEGGKVRVATARPWVYPDRMFVTPVDVATTVTGTASTPQPYTAGDVVSLTFEVDAETECEVRLHGDRFGSGDFLGAFSDVAVETPVSLELTVDDSWDEGDNRVVVRCTDLNTGLTGHGAVDIDVDAPPDPPDFTNASVGFSDSALRVTFEGIDDDDLSHYTVYVSASEFEATDWPTGGPEMVEGTFVGPVTVESAPSTSVTLRLEPLTNGTPYWVAVRATDTGGKEGAMSAVIRETPRPSFSAGSLAGEAGGNPWTCSTTGGPGFGAALLGLGLLRRRRLAVAALVVAVPTVAQAENPNRGDMERRSRGNVEVRYGFVDLAPMTDGSENPIDVVYDEHVMNMLQVEAGPQLWHVLEFDLGLGFFQELAHLETNSGADSADKTMLTAFPFSLGGTFRLELLKEQWVVPFVRGGVDLLVYTELTDNAAGSKDALRGLKVGNHWGLGADLLLDAAAPARASKLEAKSGIRDSYLVVEWRRQAIDHRELPWQASREQGLVFSGDLVTLGVKLDY